MKVGFLLFIAGILGACQTTELVQARLVDAFDDATFHVAPDRQGGAQIQHNEMLSRWEQDILYHIIINDGVIDVDIDYVEAALAKFDALISVAILPVGDDKSDANFIISFENKSRFLVNNNQQGDCFAGFEDNKGKIEKAHVVLPGKNLDIAYECLDHEIMHAIGFTGHPHGLRSTLSYTQGEDQITKWDLILIDTLYDSNLHAGMRRDVVIPKATKTISKIISEKSQ